ncbi:MAG: 7-carboxy-7-deazaguanine synthase QueE [Crocinitomicaceae bacterium]|jgi:organic radical activating enzyme|tara:strand:- start:662 stop:1285 length:624 start_codon:yes stop_codon:yes gene_type:complete
MISDSNNVKVGLPIMEQFYTIQGEGFHSGKAAYFIRIAGCDVGCVWCDVKDSWNAGDHEYHTVQSLIDNVLETKTNFCVITGGEPCMYDLNELTNLLKENGIEVALETSGCYELKGQIDWYCFSPKKFKAPVENAYLSANELKVIISHPSDFEWAEQHAAKVSKECKLYLQPEWSKQERFLSKIIDYVKENPNWNISLQTHKFMNIP